MCAMPQSALAGMTSDPRTGVVSQTRNVYIVMEKEDFSDMKSVMIRKLNLNINKYYPDAGGILMGYRGIKIKRCTFEINTTTLLHPIHIRACFYLFKPTVGTELMCVVIHREVGRVKCRAHGVFQVEVFNPPGCEDVVFVGQSVVVKVEAVEQMSWHEPKIVGSLVEMSGNNDTPFIDIVENLDTTDNETDSGMFENASLSQGVTGSRIRQVGEEVGVRGPEELIVFESSSSQVPVKTSKGDADVKQDCKKRKIEELSSPVGKVSSPVKKRNKKASKSPSSTSETSPAATDTALTPEKHSLDITPKLTSVMPTIQPKPLASSTIKNINDPPAKMSSNESFSDISPEPVPSQDDSDSSSEEEINESPKGNFTSMSSNPKADEITKTAPVCNMSTTINGTGEPSLFEIQARNTIAPNTYKSPEATKPTTVPKTPKSRFLVPPGFKMTSSGKKSKPILTAPDGVTVFRTYKGAWQWVKDQPNYLINSEPQLATESLASLGASVSTFPGVIDRHSEPPVETAPVLNGGDSFTCVAPQPSAKQPKLRKKFVPTLVANRREEKKANQQRLLIDQPSFSESKLESKSDTEYQSQSLLLPLATMTKKKLTKDDHASPGKKTATLVRKSPRAKNKLPGKSVLDNEEDNGAESYFEPIKEINSLASAKPDMIQTTSTSVDASRIASDSEDSSSEEDSMTHNKSMVEAAVKPAIPATSVDDSSSLSSGSDNNEDTVIAPVAATGSTKTVVKMADTNSSDSDSDSSEKSKLSVKKLDQVSVIDLIKSSCAAKGYSLPQKEKSQKTNQVETKSSYLSSTVMSGASKVNDMEIVPNGISPIMKTKHKKSKLGKSLGIPHLDPVMATSKCLSQKSDSKPGELDRRASDNKRMKPKKKGK